MKIFYLSCLAIALLCAGCNRGENLVPVLNGTYSGNFSVRDNGLAANLSTPVDSVAVIFNNNHYRSISESEGTSFGAQGTYQINADEIVFNDTTVHVANFDGNRVLKGTYQFSTKGDSLLIVKQLNYVFYTYKLKKQ